MSKRRACDFHRNLVYHQVKTVTGRDVLAVVPLPAPPRLPLEATDDAYGWAMRDNVQLYRRRQNMNPLGVYDQPTHAHLAPELRRLRTLALHPRPSATLALSRTPSGG